MAFIFFVFPLLKYQKILVVNNTLKLSTFRKNNTLNFTNDLYEVVVKDSEVVSYRFEKDGKYFQISPDAYIKSEELKSILNRLFKKIKRKIVVVYN